MKRQMIMLENLNCPSCAAKLEGAVRRLPGVRAASVAFGTGALTVEYDEGQLSLDEVRAVIRKLGLEPGVTLDRPSV